MAGAKLQGQLLNVACASMAREAVHSVNLCNLCNLCPRKSGMQEILTLVNVWACTASQHPSILTSASDTSRR